MIIVTGNSINITGHANVSTNPDYNIGKRVIVTGKMTYMDKKELYQLLGIKATDSYPDLTILNSVLNSVKSHYNGRLIACGYPVDINIYQPDSQETPNPNCDINIRPFHPYSGNNNYSIWFGNEKMYDLPTREDRDAKLKSIVIDRIKELVVEYLNFHIPSKKELIQLVKQQGEDIAAIKSLLNIGNGTRLTQLEAENAVLRKKIEDMAKIFNQ